MIEPGQTFGDLTVLYLLDERIGRHIQWMCKCSCGRFKSIEATYLKNGNSKSCGCRYTPKRKAYSGPEYALWCRIRSRCFSPASPDFHNYGGRGITMSNEWKDSFETFLADVGPKPGPKFSLDRIDNDGHYTAGNVRWATSLEQNNNKRNIKSYTIDGETKTFQQWCRHYNVPRERVKERIRKGWDPKLAFEAPPSQGPRPGSRRWREAQRKQS